MAKEDELKEVQVMAMRKYGRPYDALSPDEKRALYRDYEGERAMAGAQYGTGADLLATPDPTMRDNGRVTVASNPLEHIGQIANRGVGAVMQRRAMDEMKGLSKDYQLGSQAAGDVAANQQGQQMQMMAQMLRGGQPSAAPAPAPAPAPQVQQAPAQGPLGVPQAAEASGQPPIRRGLPGGPPPNAPMLTGQGPLMPGTQTPIPKTREEWQAYLLRNMNAGGM